MHLFGPLKFCTFFFANW